MAGGIVCFELKILITKHLFDQIFYRSAKKL